MLDAALRALQFADGRRREDLDDEDDPLVHALVRQVEIIGEAANKVSSETRAELPEVPWPDIVGIRNRLIHAYFDVNLDILWATVQRSLPELIRNLEPALVDSAEGLTMTENDGNLPAEIRRLLEDLDSAERDAEELVAGLSEEVGTARVAAGSWSVSECLDHLATANRVYLAAMAGAAERARAEGRLRRGPAEPGLVGRWFVSTLEPPPRLWLRMKAPRKIRPRTAPPLAEAHAAFVASQAAARSFLHANADLDLAGTRFPNPFVPGVRFSLATGLHVIPAHERRHLQQAWRARRAVEELRSAL